MADNAEAVNFQRTIGGLETFDANLETWNSYIDRFELFVDCNGVPTEKWTSTLLTLVGIKTYNLLKDLCTPEKPSMKTYAELIRLVNDHLYPKPSFIAERYKFSQRNQLQHETIPQYNAQLKKLSTFCEFGPNLNDYLRDRLVSGIANEKIKQRLISEGTQLTYEKALQIATAMEATERDVSSLAWNKCQIQALNREDRLDSVKNKHKYNKWEKKKYAVSEVCSKNVPVVKQMDKRKCNCCGREGHLWKNCRYREYKCRSCGKKGHLAYVCKNKVKAQYFVKTNEVEENVCEGELPMFMLTKKVVGIRNKSKPVLVTVKIENVAVNMEVDTGSEITAISKRYYEDNFCSFELKQTDIKLRTYDQGLIVPVGVVNVKVAYQENKIVLPLYVIENGGQPLMGREWIFPLKVLSAANVSINQIKMDYTQQIVREFPEVFSDRLGTYNEGTIKLKVKDNLQPKYYKPRAIPFALRDRVDAELDRLVSESILQPVESCDWGTPIVPVPKKNGQVRLCGDFKVTLNKQLEIDRYPIPRIEELFHRLTKGQHFSKIDLSQAYQQVLLDEESRKLVTISTHRGLFQYTRIPYGIASAPGIFQRIMEQMVVGMPGVVVFLDDILITGATPEEHLARLRRVCNVLKSKGFTVSRDKCSIFAESVEYLGVVIDKDGLHTANSKIEAMLQAPLPQDSTQLKSFIGLVGYYGKFIPNMATVLHPLYALLRKESKWDFDDKCKAAFVKIKKLLSSAPVLAHYKPELDLRLAADASAYGVGCVLSQIQENGVEHPIAYASRTLNKAERGYSQIDKEALALVYGVNRFNQFLWGQRFTLITDHRPLLSIFNPKKGLPVMAASRLQRYALFLSAYDFDIIFQKSEKHSNADALSRLPLEGKGVNQEEVEKEYSYLNSMQELGLPVSVADIRRETMRDPVLVKVKGYVKYGWPKIECKEILPFAHRKEQLSLEQDVLMWGYRVVIPMQFRQSVLKELHESHLGMVKLKSLARAYVWWPALDQDIELMVKACESCQNVRSEPAKSRLHVWDFPSGPWQRVHVDYIGPFNGQLYLLVKDAYSKWIDVFEVPSTAATPTLKHLRRLFSNFGMPEILVSDNGPPFTSVEFEEFLRMNGIRPCKAPPYHPQTNGLAENVVKTIKKTLKIALYENVPSDIALNRFLLDYRNSVHATTNETPANLMINRRLRTRLDLLRPSLRETVRKNQVKQIEQAGGKEATRILEEGTKVLVRNYRTKDKWERGVIQRSLGPVTYEVQTRKGDCWKRHIDQLWKLGEPEQNNVGKEPTKGPDTNKEVMRTEETGVGRETFKKVKEATMELAENGKQVDSADNENKPKIVDRRYPLRARKPVVKLDL